MRSDEYRKALIECLLNKKADLGRCNLMDLGAWAIAVVGAIGCAVASIVAMAIAAAVKLMCVRESSRSDSPF